MNITVRDDDSPTPTLFANIAAVGSVDEGDLTNHSVGITGTAAGNYRLFLERNGRRVDCRCYQRSDL